MKKTISLILTLAALTIASANAGDLNTSHAPEKLNFKLIPGKTYLQTYTLEQGTQVDMGGHAMTQKTRMLFDTSTEISKIENSDNKNLLIEYTRVAMTTSMPPVMPETTYDTDNPDLQSPMHAMSALLNQPVSIVVDQNNEFIEVNGLNALNDSLSNDPATAQMLQQVFNEEQFKQMMNLWLHDTFPKEAVSPGESWTFSYSMDMGQMGSIEMNCEATLKGYSDKFGHKCAVIEMTGDITMNMDFSGMAGEDEEAKEMMKQFDMKVDESTYSATMYWDNKLGYMREMIMAMELIMSMNDPRTGNRMTIPTSQTMTTVVEVK